MFDRRVLKRIPINRVAMLYFDGIRGVYPCFVRDIHPQGAGLDSSSFHIFAADFELSFDGFRTRRSCQVAWRNGYFCGVKFVEPRLIRKSAAWILATGNGNAGSGDVAVRD